MHVIDLLKVHNLEYHTWTKQLLGYVPLVITLLASADVNPCQMI